MSAPMLTSATGGSAETWLGGGFSVPMGMEGKLPIPGVKHGGLDLLVVEYDVRESHSDEPDAGELGGAKVAVLYGHAAEVLTAPQEEIRNRRVPITPPP